MSGRIFADGNTQGKSQSSFVLLELHADGAASYAVVLPNIRQQWDTWVGGEEVPQPNSNLIGDERLALAAVAGLLHLAHHARDRSAAGGNAVIRALILASSDPQKPHVALGHLRGGFGESEAGTDTVDQAATSEIGALLDDLAMPGPAVIETAAAILNELGQAFGLAELGQLSTAGLIRRRYWSRPWQNHLEAWAAQNGIEVTDETI